MLPLNQSLIDVSVQTYPKYKNLYNHPQPSDLVIFFSNEVAKAMNATLLYLARNEYIEEDHLFGKLNHPSMLAMTKVNYLYNRKLNRTFWEFYCAIQPNRATENNFVYCAVPKRKKDSVVAFISVFVDPLDKFSWLALFISFVGMIMVATLKVTRSEAFLTILSTFLSSVPSSITIYAKWENSKLLTLWTLCSMVIVIEYCGIMTTNLTRPLAEMTIRNINDLIQPNCSIVYTQQKWLDHDSRTSKLSNKVIYQNLLKLTIIKPDYMTELCFQNKITFTQFWMNALSVARLADLKLSEDSCKMLSISSTFYKECHVGEDLMESGVYFFAVLPPHNEMPSNIFRSYFEAGIYNRWNREFCAVNHSSRVQDRTRVASKWYMTFSFQR